MVAGDAFRDGVEPWRTMVGQAREAVRQELVWRQLSVHLPEAGRALDVGCGQGSQVIRLARAGHQVTGIDTSDELLAVAQASLADEPATVQGRVRLTHHDLLDLPASFHGAFDVVCCHGVVMYLPSITGAIGALAGCIRPGGLLSLLTRNQAGIAMRAGMTGDWSVVTSGLASTTYTNRLGLTGVRADDPDLVLAGLDSAGIRIDAWYGVRLFSDHWGDVPAPADLDDVVGAEEAAGSRDPYRRVAALHHFVGTRRG